MLCSDGLCGLVNDTDMNQVIQRSPYLETAAKDLIDLAKAAGGNDNITVQLVEVLESPFLESRFIDLSPSEAAPSVINANRTTAIEDRRGRSSQNKKSSRSKTMLIGVVSLLITGLSIGGFFFFMNSGVDDKADDSQTKNDVTSDKQNPEDVEGPAIFDIDSTYQYKLVLSGGESKFVKLYQYSSIEKPYAQWTLQGFDSKDDQIYFELAKKIEEADPNFGFCSEGCFIDAETSFKVCATI